MRYRTLEVKDLLERLEDEPDNLNLQNSREEIEALDISTTLIREDDFAAFAKQEANEIGLVTEVDDNWLFDCIDWQKAADKLKEDYFDIEIEGVDYLYREA